LFNWIDVVLMMKMTGGWEGFRCVTRLWGIG
jgi:hypothetical protein